MKNAGIALMCALGIVGLTVAGLLTGLMLRNDVITFLVGTRINEAHQDPNLPHDLELRRNIVQRLARTLETQYLKKVVIKYV